MLATVKALAGLFIALFSVAIYAQEPEEKWNWYYAAFYSSAPASEVLLRSGTASVKMSQSRIFLRFAEPDFPEMQASFSGWITNAKNIQGSLDGFFPSGPDDFVGTYRQSGDAKSCHWQEIVLRRSIPDGSFLVLSRVEGPCQ